MASLPKCLSQATEDLKGRFQVVHDLLRLEQ